MDPERPLPTEIGRYHIVRLLGQGAMGRVLLAHDSVLDRDVAVKLLRDDLGLPAEHRRALLDRMRNEARASARVSHPNIVALHDMGEMPDVGLFLVFEYAEGETLKERLARGPIAPDLAARIARQVGDALTTAHDAGVLHRDIKPENLILTRTGPKIADFGIARIPDSTLTRDGGLLGTPAYSAPEAISDGSFSSASDQFSFAASLWEALSGRRAFPGDDAVAVASRIATDEPPKIAEICSLDPRVDTILARGLSKNPRGRFPTCREFGAALADTLEGAPRPTLATVPDQYHRTAAVARERNRWLRVSVGGAAVGAVGVVAVVQVWRGLDPPERPLPIVPSALSLAPDAGASAARPPTSTPARTTIPRAVSAPTATSSRVEPRDAGAAPFDAGEDAEAIPSAAPSTAAPEGAPDAATP